MSALIQALTIGRHICNRQTNGTHMTVIFILIGISLVVATGFLLAFLWAVNSGQYDDDYTPSVRMLFDDDGPNSSQSTKRV